MAEKRNKVYCDGTVLRIATGAIGQNNTSAVLVDVQSPHGGGTCTLWLSEAAMDSTIEKMGEMGMPAGVGVAWIDDNPNALTGNTVRLCHYEEEYNGEWTKKIDIVGKPKARPLDPNEKARLDQMFMSRNVGGGTPFDETQV